MWGDEKFMALSPLPPCGQALWLYLLTGPQTGIIPGLYKAGRMAMAEDLGWTPEAFDEAFAEALNQGLVKADWKARLVWIPNAVLHNPPASLNVVKAWSKAFAELPECSLKNEAEREILAYLESLGGQYRQAFAPLSKATPKPSVKPSCKATPKESLEPLGIQEQEQEQEQENPSPSPLPLSGAGVSEWGGATFGNAEAPTLAGIVCRRMRTLGLDGVQPAHPSLLRLIEAGASIAEFEGAAKAAKDRQKGFAYALAMLERQRSEAAKLVLHTGQMPEKPETEWEKTQRRRRENAEYTRRAADWNNDREGESHDLDALEGQCQRVA
jgi:hypothetical protein